MMSTLNVPSVHDTGQRKSHALMSILQAGENDESVDILVDKIVEIAEEVLDSERVLLFFVGTAPDLFSLTCPFSSSIPLTLPLDRGIPGYVARTGRVHNTRHAASDPHHDPSIDARLGVTTRTCLCIPIVNSAGTVYAVLQAINKRRPGQDDEEDGGGGGAGGGAGGGGEERKEAAGEEGEAEPVYSVEDEEIGVAFCVGVHSTLRRRLTEVVMWRSRRGGEGGDKGIQSMLEIYGNSAHTGGRGTGVSGGYGDRGAQTDRVKRRSLGAAQFTTAVLHSIYHPHHSQIPEPSQLLPSVSDGSPLLLIDPQRRATWSRTMSMPFKGRRMPVTTLDLSHTTDLSVIGLAAGAGAAAAHKADGGGGDVGGSGSARQGVGSSAYTVLSNGAWQSPRGSRKGGLVPSHSALALYNTLPSHTRTLNSSHSTTTSNSGSVHPQPYSAHLSSYSHITHYTNSPLAMQPRGLPATSSTSTFSPLLMPMSLPAPSSSEEYLPTSATVASSTTISFASGPSSPMLPSSAAEEAASRGKAILTTSSRSSLTFPPSSPPSTSSSLITSVTFSSLDSLHSSPTSAPITASFPSFHSTSAVLPSRTSSSPSRFAAPWAAFDSEREEDSHSPPQQQPQQPPTMSSTASSTGSSPGFSSTQSSEASALRSSFSLPGPAPIVDELKSVTAAPPPSALASAITLSSLQSAAAEEEAESNAHEGGASASAGETPPPVSATTTSSLLLDSPPSTSMSSALGAAFLAPVACMTWPSLPASSLPDLDTLTSLSFNPFDYSEDALLHCCLLMLHSLDLTRHFGLDQATLQSFLLSVRSRYRHNPYHNWYHATSVMQFAYFTVRSTEAGDCLPKLDLLALLLAALCHDIDHPGTTNSFQVMAASPLALLYNDQAVLENHHAATTFTLLSHPSSSILSPLHSTLSQQQGARAA